MANIQINAPQKGLLKPFLNKPPCCLLQSFEWYLQLVQIAGIYACNPYKILWKLSHMRKCVIT